ncbi:DUF7426 family protein [Saccharopolyspora taberi]|uniref:DUF7426 domain-containing protein n=1 Tax=Saccharopolyspora taberi TaxID=60895 RepID=A0ABN3V0A1_9PSEU
MALRDLDEFLDPTLSLPIRGKVYTVDPPDAATGLRLQRLSDWMIGTAAAVETEVDAPAPTAELVDDAAELDMYRAALGGAYDDMVADGLPWPTLKVAGMTAFLHWTVDPETAEAYWSAGGRPERPAGNRAQRRTARSTPQPASPSGTPPARKTPAKAGTRGGKSSRAGR